MRKISFIPLCITLFAASACGGGADVTTGSGGSGAGPATSSASTGGLVGDTVTLSMTPFVVPSGGEVYKCQNFANPFVGQDANVTKFESHMTPGSHHLLLFYRPAATD